MTALPKKKFISPEEYLELEAKSDVRHEYFGGKVYQMAGANYRHNLIAGNIYASLHAHFRKRTCSAFQNDMRLFVEKTGLYTYPDVMAICGTPKLKTHKGLETLLNPDLVIEVLSPSTADYDRGNKFEHYREVESLREYVLVWQDSKRIARYTRLEGGSWKLTDFIGDEVTIELSSVDCTLSMNDIYEKVDLPGHISSPDSLRRPL